MIMTDFYIGHRSGEPPNFATWHRLSPNPYPVDVGMLQNIVLFTGIYATIVRNMKLDSGGAAQSARQKRPKLG
jgi:hypothetical protein